MTLEELEHSLVPSGGSHPFWEYRKGPFLFRVEERGIDQRSHPSHVVRYVGSISVRECRLYYVNVAYRALLLGDLVSYFNNLDSRALFEASCFLQGFGESVGRPALERLGRDFL